MSEISQPVSSTTPEFAAVFLNSTGTAVPPTQITQSEAIGLIDTYYSRTLSHRSMSLLRKVLEHPAIETRYLAVDSRKDIPLLKDEDPDARMERFTRWAIRLSKEAAVMALKNAKIEPSAVSALVVNTCTGYLCPGIGTYLLEELGLRLQTRVYDLVGAGCGGALPSLQIAESIVAGNPQAVVLCIAVEICTATYQMADDISLLISNAIFGDGAAAAVISGKPTGISMIDAASRFNPSRRDDVRYVYKNGQLHNRLAIDLPQTIQSSIPPFVIEFLDKNNLAIKDISWWMIHPGGDKILSAVQKGLSLTDHDLQTARRVLLKYGNMSSPSVLFELGELLERDLKSGDYICMLGFGAGLSMHACLLRRP